MLNQIMKVQATKLLTYLVNECQGVSNEVAYMHRALHAQSDNEGASKCA
ncbi:MAG: hypothetical protein ACRCV0_00345 [Brevinema sp.]